MVQQCFLLLKSSKKQFNIFKKKSEKNNSLDSLIVTQENK